MAIAAFSRESAVPVPNASSFLELYAFERPEPAKPVDEFISELKALIRAHPVDAQLTAHGVPACRSTSRAPQLPFR